MASIINSTTTAGVTVTGDNSGSLQLATNNGTTAVTIDTSQNVGIGTTSPAVKLDAVVTGNSLNSIIAARNTTSGTAAGSQILVGNDSSNDLLVLRALSSTYTSSGVNTANGSLIRAGGAGGMTLAATDGSGIINFATGGTTERMRITSSGNLLIARTSDIDSSYTMHLAVATDNGFITIPTTNKFYNALGFRNSSNTEVGYINCTASATSFGTSSDYRLKHDVVPMTGALEKVALLKPVTYKWNIDGSNGQGFIAHELQAVVPECVTGEKDAVDAEGNPKYQGIDTSFLVATLTAAIQELKAELDATKAEVQALKGVA